MALDALGSVAMLITVGMLITLVGAVGAFFGFIYAGQHNLPDSAQYGFGCGGGSSDRMMIRRDRAEILAVESSRR